MTDHSTVAPDRPDLASRGEEFAAFWAERHLCTLSTVRPDGTPHVVPVGVTLDLESGIARVIARRGTRKARLIAKAGEAGVPVAVCQVERARWSTLEGRAIVRDDREAVADAERRYAERYQRTPSPNPERIVIEIALTGVKGSV
ncbi:pyridoxamine 5'-phosphate oxidase family protein [Nocardiopsis ansamitocini]|uniref:PPOX class F420-dependent enzyme n=1 Tax=Nocardiopsis ansamitocini TaxID=1670832 RepID=A0A9W6P4Z4_9ACTN|nr:pyridoxamine 5'-phosphate oxidase family protein [Nocardiopsis ansamitocini]GLU47188.1 PPOX class F420-dependent enzyme [Nocardiopsis ansamitocini]